MSAGGRSVSVVNGIVEAERVGVKTVPHRLRDGACTRTRGCRGHERRHRETRVGKWSKGDEEELWCKEQSSRGRVEFKVSKMIRFCGWWRRALCLGIGARQQATATSKSNSVGWRPLK
jgi:hypothetical protein